MPTANQPKVSLPGDIAPIQAFLAEWQEAIDTGNADLFNKRFAGDVLWGSPFGAIASGYGQIHAIHERMFSLVVPVKGAAKFELEQTMFLSEKVAIAYVRRVSQLHHPVHHQTKPNSFDELALLVLVEQSGQWWLAAAQHVPDKREVYQNK